jgi:uncharacterized phosphatase
MKSFLFVRHGVTDWSPSLNLEPVDYAINEKGRLEAQNAAIYVKGKIAADKKSIILSSTLLRAKQTAGIISEYCSIPVIFEENLRERYFGDARIGYSDAESDEIFVERVQLALKHMKSIMELQDRYLIVVSHSKVFQQVARILSINPGTIVTGGCVELCDTKEL